MTSPLPYPIHTIAEAAAQIAQGEDPWFALGNFLHDWWRYAVDVRADLIAELPAPGTTLDEKRWEHFVQLLLKNSAPERVSPVLHGPMHPTMCLNSRGFSIRNQRNGTGCSLPPLTRFNVAMCLWVEAFLTINMTCNRYMAQNLSGLSGQMRNYKDSSNQS